MLVWSLSQLQHHCYLSPNMFLLLILITFYQTNTDKIGVNGDRAESSNKVKKKMSRNKSRFGATVKGRPNKTARPTANRTPRSSNRQQQPTTLTSTATGHRSLSECGRVGGGNHERTVLSGVPHLENEMWSRKRYLGTQFIYAFEIS